jgi:non-ribosomal peptide synthetase component F
VVISLIPVALTSAAQLAIDPDNPPAQVKWMLRDMAPHVLVSQGSLPARLGDHGKGRETMLVDEETTGRRFVSGHAPAPCVPGGPGTAACLVYSSGPAGDPRAWLIPRRSLLSRLAWLQRRFRNART